MKEVKGIKVDGCLYYNDHMGTPHSVVLKCVHYKSVDSVIMLQNVIFEDVAGNQWEYKALVSADNDSKVVSIPSIKLEHVWLKMVKQ